MSARGSAREPADRGPAVEVEVERVSLTGSPARRIVHLAPNHIHMPRIISMFEEAFPGQNRFIVASQRDGCVEPADHVEFSSKEWIRSSRIAADLAGAEFVLLHNMNREHAQALRYVPHDAVVVWIGWGADYYELIEPLLGRLLLERTEQLTRELRSTAAARQSMLTRWKSSLRPRLKSVLRAVGARPAAIVAAAPYIDVCCVNSADIVLLRQALPSLRARHHVIPLYTVEDSFDPGGVDQVGPDILLGNSATATNNHIEAFELLGARQADRSRVVVPLSYGDPAYAKAVAAIGRQCLGERLDPVLEWMSVGNYNQRVGACGFVVMNHRRQQAVGNIGAALYHGATVYLRRENPLFGFYRDLGVHIRAVDELATGLDQALEPLTAAQREHNVRFIGHYYRRDTVVAAARALASFSRAPQAAKARAPAVG